VRFHAVYWLALLLSAGQPLPTAIFVHEYLTVDGAKISKSAGPAVDPYDVVERYGVDALRWWLLSDVAGLGDSDFTEQRLRTRYHQDLANGLGNLVSRTLSLVRKYGHGDAPASGLGRELSSTIDRALEVFDFRAATDAIGAVVGEANRLIEAERPWESAKPQRDAVLAALEGACRSLAHELTPFVPDGAARISAQLDGGIRQPVFPRLE